MSALRFVAGVLVLLICACAAGFAPASATGRSNDPTAAPSGGDPTTLKPGFELDGPGSADAVAWGRFGGYDVRIASDAITATARGPRELWLKLGLPGADLDRPHPVGRPILHSSYLVGDRKKDWSLRVPRFEKLRFADAYPGVDVVVRVSRSQFEYDFELDSPRALDEIAIDVSSSHPLDQRGSELVVSNGDEVLRQEAPRAWQTIAGRRKGVPSELSVDGRHARFVVGPHDTTQPLVVDPRVSFSTRFGGPEREWINEVVAGSDGKTYACGESESAEIILGSPTDADTTGFIAEFSPLGDLLSIVYIGGSGEDSLVDCDLSGGMMSAAGFTRSSDFPTWNAYQPAIADDEAADAFVLTYSLASNQLGFSTYLGSIYSEEASSVEFGPSGTVYALGGHSGSMHSVNGIPDSAHWRGWLGKFQSNGSLVFLTRVGVSRALAVAADGSAVVAGYTGQGNLPTKDAYQPQASAQENYHEGYIARVAPSGSTLMHATYFGGGEWETIEDLVLTPDNEIVVAGTTASPRLPMVDPIQGEIRNWDAFVAKFSPDTSDLLFSTFMGGHDNEDLDDLALAPDGTVHLTGETFSHDLPLVDPLIDRIQRTSDLFWIQVDMDTPRIVRSSYWGGTDLYAWPDGGREDRGVLTVDDEGIVTIAGRGGSTTFPLAHPIQTIGDVFLTRFGDERTASRKIDLRFVGSGGGRTSASSDALDCSSDCSASLLDGTSVNVSGLADQGSKFVGWEGPCIGFRRCNFLAWHNATLKARFEEALDPSVPVVTLKPDRTFLLRSRIPMVIATRDRGTGVAYVEVKNGPDSLDPWRASANELIHGSAEVGGTLCFGASAVDKVDNRSDYGRFECTTVPFDDAQMVNEGSWEDVGTKKHFRGTAKRSSSPGDALVRERVSGYRMVLVATHCPDCGKVKVLLQRSGKTRWTVLKTVDLEAETTRHRVLTTVLRSDERVTGHVKVEVAKARSRSMASACRPSESTR